MCVCGCVCVCVCACLCVWAPSTHTEVEEGHVDALLGRRPRDQVPAVNAVDHAQAHARAYPPLRHHDRRCSVRGTPRTVATPASSGPGVHSICIGRVPFTHFHLDALCATSLNGTRPFEFTVTRGTHRTPRRPCCPGRSSSAPRGTGCTSWC